MTSTVRLRGLSDKRIKCIVSGRVILSIHRDEIKGNVAKASWLIANGTRRNGIRATYLRVRFFMIRCYVYRLAVVQKTYNIIPMKIATIPDASGHPHWFNLREYIARAPKFHCGEKKPHSKVEREGKRGRKTGKNRERWNNLENSSIHLYFEGLQYLLASLTHSPAATEVFLPAYLICARNSGGSK